jgi:Nitrile hydratase, alpha chain
MERGAHIRALENTPKVHNLVVCTLCSCYPWDVIGLPPTWYKSAPYRSRAVIDPRGATRLQPQLAINKRPKIGMRPDLPHPNTAIHGIAPANVEIGGAALLALSR